MRRQPFEIAVFLRSDPRSPLIMERWVREGEGEEDGKQKRKGRKRMGSIVSPHRTEILDTPLPPITTRNGLKTTLFIVSKR